MFDKWRNQTTSWPSKCITNFNIQSWVQSTATSLLEAAVNQPITLSNYPFQVMYPKNITWWQASSLQIQANLIKESAEQV